MIIKLICAPFVLLVKALLSAISFQIVIPASIADTITLLVKAMQFFPFDVWVLCLGSFTFWIAVHILIGIFVFLLGKIPLINIH